MKEITVFAGMTFYFKITFYSVSRLVGLMLN